MKRDPVDQAHAAYGLRLLKRHRLGRVIVTTASSRRC
jgi:hypothetical protein